MRICHVTAHLPPDQAANALLPFHLGTWGREAGDDIHFIANPPRALAQGADEAAGMAAAAAGLPGSVTWIPRPAGASAVARALGLSSLREAMRIRRLTADAVDRADVVHVHSNGLLPEVMAWEARRAGKPLVLTLYGTEIWHYKRKWPRPDLFTRAYRAADQVTFYSQGLLDFARGLGLDRPGLRVIYPPVPSHFSPPTPEQRQRLRASLGLRERFVLINVKRLHPLAGQRYLIEAMPDVIRQVPDTRLVFCGTGPLRDELEQLARTLGVAAHVTFAGLVDNRVVADYYGAADLFVLPSLLEACPTVAIEALGCGTPVLTADHPGGVELGGLFGADVSVVPREHPEALARAIATFLSAPHRASDTARAVIAREFGSSVVAGRFADAYRAAAEGRRS